jgi:hypothetical protein
LPTCPRPGVSQVDLKVWLILLVPISPGIISLWFVLSLTRMFPFCLCCTKHATTFECVYVFWGAGVGAGVELRALRLLSRCSTAQATPPAIFALIIWKGGSHFLPRPAWTMILLFYSFYHCWDDRHAPPHPAFLLLLR